MQATCPGTDPARGPLPRRGFLAALMAAGSALIGAILAVPVARVALFPVLRRGEDAPWTDLGPLDRLQPAPGTPLAVPLTVERTDGWQLARADHTVYLVNSPEGAGAVPRVLSSVCPHLGCTVQWHPERERFICPCHGGTYAPDGARLAGPPARGMDPLPVRVVQGRLQVRFLSFRQLLNHQELAD